MIVSNISYLCYVIRWMTDIFEHKKVFSIILRG
nr:MAG TPA: hypothetical protein [Caudoviricetes sp.]